MSSAGEAIYRARCVDADVQWTCPGLIGAAAEGLVQV